MKLVIVNTGVANLASVNFAFKRLGVEAVVSSDPDVIRSASHVVLPGVGTASAAMRSLTELQLIDVLRELTQPVLGICLGMQMLTNSSSEQYSQQSSLQKGSAPLPCLGVIDTQVERLHNKDNLPLPHMGWNATEVTDHPLFKGFAGEQPYFYYVHTYAAPAEPHCIARCEYTQPFAAAIAQGNFMGVQFHPERSGDAGARVLQNFLEITC
ncbi:imidazole glycerol phosphate synthase subunit HisH [Aliidiomarina sedimenti]|uniref:Imidazole glycerol phosphate synthase subunit HisH n=1 Tax=Aliidiomarina sedimenti TaxID=1933879 RepID=A0ABY0BX37_9GAMM|nr:imidazole glycerol phosphate synthase subunit HisH [Aliidiomarina sedimenti]RUO28924.1 imidazole glycerol phosphate synthase subunit HisH [Aliidiomarina sedimenti]